MGTSSSLTDPPSSHGGRPLTGGEAIVELLARFGVEVMFGLPGDQTAIYDALYGHPSVRHVLVRHEQAAAHMADAYARSTGKVGICDASIGPGATNLLSGIAEAFLSGIPVVALVSAVRSDWRGRDAFQEIDQVAVFEPVTKGAFSVDHVARIPEFVARAFRLATSGRPGPVLLSFPIDVLRAEHDFNASDLEVDERYGRFPAHRPTPPQADIVAAADALLTARRPVILAGGGVIASGAMDEVCQLAELLDIPVATTFMGKGTLREDHPLCLGPFGLLGRTAANDYILQADLALAVGTRFTNVDTMAWRVPTPQTKIVQIDIESTQIGRNYAVDQAVTGDIQAVLQAMLSLVTPRGDTTDYRSPKDEVAALTAAWRAEKGIETAVAKGLDSEPVHPLQVIRALRMAMNDDDVLICDSGFNQIWGGQYFEVRSPGRTYIGPRGFGAMGFSLPAAIAHALAHPDKRVVALCGDGGFAMVMQELETALRSGAPITVCIMNNSSLQFIRENQRLLYDARFISTEFSDLDYAAIARSFGCLGIRVDRSGDLSAALSLALTSESPAVIDIRIDPDIIPDRTSLQNLS